jgi:signal transduction histidine kinase
MVDDALPAPTAAPAPPVAPRRVRWFVAVPPKVLLALALTALVSMIVLAVSEFSSARVNETRAEAMRLRGVVGAVAAIRDGVTYAESAQRGFLLTHERRYLEPFNDATARTQRAFVEVTALTQGHAEASLRAQTLVKLATQKLDEMRLVVTYEEQGRREQAMTLLSSGLGVDIMEELVKVADAFENDQLREFTARQAEIDDALVQQRVAVGIVVFINLVFLSVLANMMIRQFTQRESHRAELEALAARLEQQVAARTAELSSLSAHLQSSSEREKSRLARDLHDELGGILTAAKIDTAWLEGHSKTTDPDALQRIRRLSGVLDEAVDLKRRVIENLRPSLLDHLGLAAALEWYVNDTCSKAGLQCKLRLPNQDAVVDPDVAIAIFRLVQEALTNAVKYARAGEISVSLERDESHWKLELADNGVGIAGFRADQLSHGLAGMRQRALSHGGRFALHTAPGQGTRIEALFPLRAN